MKDENRENFSTRRIDIFEFISLRLIVRIFTLGFLGRL